jgi:hypothetical protein
MRNYCNSLIEDIEEDAFFIQKMLSEISDQSIKITHITFQ